MDRFSAVARCLRSAAAQTYGTFEVGSTQAKFLRQIARTSGISQAELARATATDPTLTGRALETLVQRGWVRRKRSQQDRRQYVLELSASGKRTRAKVEKARAGIAQRAVAALDTRDLEAFERIAEKLLATFGSDTAGGGGGK